MFDCPEPFRERTRRELGLVILENNAKSLDWGIIEVMYLYFEGVCYRN